MGNLGVQSGKTGRGFQTEWATVWEQAAGLFFISANNSSLIYSRLCLKEHSLQNEMDSESAFEFHNQYLGNKFVQ